MPHNVLVEFSDIDAIDHHLWLEGVKVVLSPADGTLAAVIPNLDVTNALEVLFVAIGASGSGCILSITVDGRGPQRWSGVYGAKSTAIVVDLLDLPIPKDPADRGLNPAA